MDPFNDYAINFTQNELTSRIIITVTPNGRKHNTYVSGWDVDLSLLKQYLATIKKSKGCNGSIKKAKVIQQGNNDDYSDNENNLSDNEDNLSDNEDNQSDNDDQTNYNYKKVNKKRKEEKKSDKYVLHFQGNHANYIKEFIISTGFEESLIYLRG